MVAYLSPLIEVGAHDVTVAQLESTPLEDADGDIELEKGARVHAVLGEGSERDPPPVRDGTAHDAAAAVAAVVAHGEHHAERDVEPLKVEPRGIRTLADDQDRRNGHAERTKAVMQEVGIEGQADADAAVDAGRGVRRNGRQRRTEHQLPFKVRDALGQQR